MIGRAILVAFTFVIAIIIFTFTLPSVLSESDNARYTSTTTPLNCTTDVNGVCLLTLPSKHANSTTEGIDVSDANTSASYTSDTSISADQSVLSVSNLTSNTSYNMTVVHYVITQGMGDNLNQLLARLPLILTLGLAVLLTVGGGRFIMMRG